eukprot:scaffold4.g4948.t1
MRTRSRDGPAGGGLPAGKAIAKKKPAKLKVPVEKKKVVVKALAKRKRSASAREEMPATAQAEAPPAARKARKSSAALADAVSLATALHNTLLIEIFTRVGDQTFCREVLPLVCKRFRAVLLEPSSVWESLHIDFLNKGTDLELLAQSGCLADAADQGRNRRLMRSAVERWVNPRASSIKTLVVSFSEKEPTHSFPKNGSGLTKLLGMLGSSLEQLHISCCSDIFVGTSFASVTQLQCLEKLAVTFNSAQLTPADLLPLEQCRRLRSLTIACSAQREEAGQPCIAAFPESLVRLRGLTSLALASKGVTAVPAGIARLKGLQCLDLSGCGIPLLPPALTKLTGLQHLRLNGTRVSAGLASFWTPLAKLPALQSVELRSTHAFMLPLLGEAVKLRALTSLDLSNNQIDPVSLGYTDVLASLGSMPHLRRLVLRRNMLSAVPDCFSELSHLTHLDVSHNGLVDLPASLASLEQLRELAAEGNSFPRIPQVLHKLPALEVADLSFCIYLEAASSLAALAEQGFPRLRRLDLRKLVASWQPSSHTWLEGLERALKAAGRPKDCVLWDAPATPKT